MMPPVENFSLAVSGNGLFLERFVPLLKVRFPAIIIYDRNEEASRPPSNEAFPAHPEVADIDALFLLSGGKETATIRNRREHRYFNYVPEQDQSSRHDFLLNQMVRAVEQLIAVKPVVQEEPMTVDLIEGPPGTAAAEEVESSMAIKD